MNKFSNREKILRYISRIIVDWHDAYVVSAKDIANSTGLSKYKVLKILHELRDEGLVERATQGCPAQISYGETVELICEAMPPLNGWTLTHNGHESEIFKTVKKEYIRELEEWANGYDNEEVSL